MAESPSRCETTLVFGEAFTSGAAMLSLIALPEDILAKVRWLA
jgi:hypothetical protein